ncbi:MAG: ABC transporter substrate-binding protein [Deltaproteobacteria bacterium]|nr:ABC transporter substrate-binding protein [Deltaproteobacteria bacterium]
MNMSVEFDWPLSMMPSTFPTSVSSPGTNGRSFGLTTARGSRNFNVAIRLVPPSGLIRNQEYIYAILPPHHNHCGQLSLTAGSNYPRCKAHVNLLANRNRRAIVAWALMLLFCSAAPVSGQGTTLRVGTNSPASTESVSYAVAKDAGILRPYQLDVEVIYIAGGTLSVQALVGKSLDFLGTGGTPFILAFLEGAPAKILVGVHNRLPYALIAQRSIVTEAQLKGKKIGISRFGSTDDYALKLALAQFGLTAKDVVILQTGGPGTRLSALRAGSIDATVLTSGLAQIAVKSGNNLLIDFADKAIDYQQVALIARDDLLKSQPDLVRRFATGYLDAIRFYKSQRELAIKKTMAALRTNDREIAEFDYNLRVRALPDDGKPTLKGLQVALDDIAKDNPKAKSLSVAQLIDTNFLP